VVRCRSEVFKFRNYDPETGSARKHAKLGEDDTVEKAMEGEVDRVIAEDAVRRAEELVSPPSILYHWGRRRDGGRAMGSWDGRADSVTPLSAPLRVVEPIEYTSEEA
jgi:coiled-coil domain-containing protein 12